MNSYELDLFPFGSFKMPKLPRLLEQNYYVNCGKDIRQSVSDDKLTFSMDLPGVKPEDLELVVEKHGITIKAKRFDCESANEHYISVNDVWDIESAEATIEHGILTVSMGKKPERKAKTIKLISK